LLLRLAQGEGAKHDKDIVAAVQILTAIQAEATQHGLGLIAQKAKKDIASYVDVARRTSNRHDLTLSIARYWIE
jgi:hypothetical protein